jgi:hypothetical protein
VTAERVGVANSEAAVRVDVLPEWLANPANTSFL